MKKIIRVTAVASFFIVGLFTLGFADETLTISTYYPSPFGSYRELTAHRMKIGRTYSSSGTTVGDNNLIVEGAVGIATSTLAGYALNVNGNVLAAGALGVRAAIFQDINSSYFIDPDPSASSLSGDLRGSLCIGTNFCADTPAGGLKASNGIFIPGSLGAESLRINFGDVIIGAGKVAIGGAVGPERFLVAVNEPSRFAGNLGIRKFPTCALDVEGTIRASGGTPIYSCPAGPSYFDWSNCRGQLQTAPTCADSGGGSTACTLVGRMVAP